MELAKGEYITSITIGKCRFLLGWTEHSRVCFLQIRTNVSLRLECGEAYPGNSARRIGSHCIFDPRRHLHLLTLVDLEKVWNRTDSAVVAFSGRRGDPMDALEAYFIPISEFWQAGPHRWWRIVHFSGVLLIRWYFSAFRNASEYSISSEIQRWTILMQILWIRCSGDEPGV